MSTSTTVNHKKHVLEASVKNLTTDRLNSNILEFSRGGNISSTDEEKDLCLERLIESTLDKKTRQDCKTYSKMTKYQ